MVLIFSHEIRTTLIFLIRTMVLNEKSLRFPKTKEPNIDGFSQKFKNANNQTLTKKGGSYKNECIVLVINRNDS